MKRIVVVLMILSLAITSINTRADITDLNKIKVKSEEVGDRLIVALEGVDTDGLLVKLFDQSGNLLTSKTLTAETKKLELENYKKGVYWITLTKNHEMTYRRIDLS